MTKKTLIEIALNNSKHIKEAESKFVNILTIKQACFNYLYRKNKFMIENQKQADCLIFTCLCGLENKGALINKK